MQRNLSQIKLTEEEQVKNAGLFLDFDEIARKGAMSKEEVLIAKWYGIYRSRQAGDHMARIVIPGGQMTAMHVKAIARLADKYASGKISFTTRQSAQYHKLQLKELPEMLRDLKKEGLTTFHGCGDVTRNVAACPWANICQHRRFDVLPYAKKAARVLSDSRDLDNLPRKFKVNFSGCGANCGQPYINCVGANALVRKNERGVEETGFEVVIGGGMGWKPFVAQQLYSFVPAESIVAITRAVGLLFSEQGDRTQRKFARLKFVVDRLGIEKCRELLADIYRREGVDSSAFETDPAADCGPEIPTRPLRDTNPTDDNGLGIQRIMIPKGEIAASDLEQISELAELYADGYVYSTNRQNLELHGVDASRLAVLQKELRDMGLLADGFYGLQDMVACVGTTYCPLAVTKTHEMFDRLTPIANDPKYAPIREKILVNITGCPNSCAQYYIADIGMRGLRIREKTGSAEGYQIRIGGTQTGFGRIVGDFKMDDCETVVRCVLDSFMEVCAKTDYDSLAAHIRDEGPGLYQEKIDALNIRYANQAPNPLEYSTDTGEVSTATDFKVIAKDVPCQDACPAKTNVPEYIRLIKEGRHDEAHLINQEDNVLPGVLGRICTHPCQDDCRHQWTNTQGPVRICSLKRSAADIKAGKSKPLGAYFEPTGKKTAVIGAGPAGLAAARELKRCGHEVTIFEKQPYAGGQVRMGVPEFRLPHGILNEDIEAILDMGIEVRYEQSVDAAKIDELCGQYDAVLLAAGANVPRSIRFDGLPEGVAIEGLNFMKHYNDKDPVDIEGDVLIIGGGFTAVDCARSARRLAPDASISIMYRRGEAQMAASEEEFEQMENEHIRIQTHVSPVSATVTDGKLASVTFVRNRLGEPDESGKPSFTQIECSEFTVECQTLILAIGQSAEKSLIPAGVEINDEHLTTKGGLFVAGDFSMGNGDV
ncbi:MAG: FAD-dependent oxidoreductase, partial [Planctomycetota bacterium]